MKTPRESDDVISLSRSLWSVTIVGALLTLLTPFVAELDAVLSVAIGAAIGVANLYVLGRVVQAFLSPTGARLPWTVVVLLKFAGLFGGVYLLVQYAGVQVLPLVVGYGALPLGIVFSQVKHQSPISGES